MFHRQSLSRVKQDEAGVEEELCGGFSRMATLLRRQDLSDYILRELHIVRRGVARRVNIQRLPDIVELAWLKQPSDAADAVRILALRLRLSRGDVHDR